MKKARSARDRGAFKQAALPPPLPPFEELDALAATDTPTVQSAWWITHQVSEHVFATIARSDPRTGESLPRPLTEILRDVRHATATGSRPFPRDRLLSAAELASDSLEHLLDRHRHRIVRVHEQLPFHQLREVDTRSMAWLARQPGRNIREKLSGRTHALGVKRDVSADTTENRLLRSFAKLLVRRASNRLAFTSAYDETAGDVDRVRRMEDCVRLCDERMRRSELAHVPTLTRLQPNNVLLSDPHYSRVFRAWKWLRDDEEALRGSWKDTLQRARVLLCWMVAALLVTRERVVMAETLGRVLTGRDDDHKLGVEVLGAEVVGADWFLNPPLHFLVLPAGHEDVAFRIRMSLEGEFILAHIATLGGRGRLGEESVSALTFEVRASSERLQARRGIGIAVEGLESSLRGAERVYADLAGFAPLATQMTRQLLQHCGVNPNVQKPDRIASGRAADGARLGIELGSSSLHVNAEQAITLTTASWTLAISLPGDAGGFEWIDGRAERELVVGAANRSLWATGDVVDADEQADVGMLALAADRVLSGLASELRVPADARVAYAVPDAVDEFSQRNMRGAFGASFYRPVPVWRSVAAATVWTSTAGERAPRSGDSVVVVDTEFGGVSLTVLTARYDEKLARTHPASRGLYWERKPPLPPDERLEMLGWPHVLRAYARMLVARVLGAVVPELQERVVDDLLRSGKITTLVERGGSIFVQVPSSQHTTPEVVELFEDPVWFDDEVGRWLERVDSTVKDALASLGWPRAVLIGGPCAYERFGRLGAPTGRIKFFDEAKGFGFIVPDGGGGDLYFHASAWATERRPCSNDLVEFEIGRGRKGPEAKRVTSVPRLTEWLRRRPCVAPHGLAHGARECLLRLDSGSLTWREWLPELSLEVVRDGHFGELPLLERGTFVDPFLGDAIQFTVPETLTLERGHRWFSFPLLVGRQGRRPIAWEAHLESSAFPLDHDVRARLRLSYRYGLDNSYELAVEPESQADAPFTRVEAKWIRGGKAITAATSHEVLAFHAAPWDAEDASKFLDAARSVDRLDTEKFGKFLFAVTRVCWSQGRCIATAPPAVQQAFPVFRDTLLRALHRTPTLSVQQVPRVLEVLALLHEDAPADIAERILQLDDEAADDPTLYRKTAAMMATLVGDGMDLRAPLLERLLARLRRHTDVDTFDGALAGVTMRALGSAAWRHPDFIAALTATPAAVARVLGQCRRSLQNLLARVPLNIASEEERGQVARRLGTPFRDACELILALLRVDPSDPTVAPLHCGSPSADAFAKAVRQLDARFATIGVDVHWRIHLNAEIPAALHRMSPVAFALNSYLADGAGANLVHVESAEVD